LFLIFHTDPQRLVPEYSSPSIYRDHNSTQSITKASHAVCTAA